MPKLVHPSAAVQALVVIQKYMIADTSNDEDRERLDKAMVSLASNMIQTYFVVEELEARLKQLETK